jgi:hypothetical protein
MRFNSSRKWWYISCFFFKHLDALFPLFFYLRQIPVEISRVASHSGKTFLEKKHRVLSKRMKSQKELLAITRKILVIIFNVLKTGQSFDPKRNLQATVPD